MVRDMWRFRAGAVTVLLVLFFVLVSGCGAKPPGKVRYDGTKDGAKVISPFSLRMAIEVEGDLVSGVAGEVRVVHGYHVLIIDDDPPALGVPVPVDERHRHYPEEQKDAEFEYVLIGEAKTLSGAPSMVTEVLVKLDPGQYTLQQVFVKEDGVPYEPLVAETIGITVTSHREVFFIEPKEGAQVTSPFVVRIGSLGLVAEPAGEVKDGAGHHHIIVDADIWTSTGRIPPNGQYMHLDEGETQATLNLAPGIHTLHMQFAFGNDIPFSPILADTIQITVVE